MEWNMERLHERRHAATRLGSHWRWDLTGRWKQLEHAEVRILQWGFGSKALEVKPGCSLVREGQESSGWLSIDRNRLIALTKQVAIMISAVPNPLTASASVKAILPSTGARSELDLEPSLSPHTQAIAKTLQQ
jgi:hypothetical protein